MKWMRKMKEMIGLLSSSKKRRKKKGSGGQAGPIHVVHELTDARRRIMVVVRDPFFTSRLFRQGRDGATKLPCMRNSSKGGRTKAKRERGCFEFKDKGTGFKRSRKMNDQRSRD